MTVRNALALGAAMAAAAVLAVTSAGAAGGDRKVIAEANANGLRVEVTAQKVAKPDGEPPAATVRVSAFQREGGNWKRLGRALTVGQKASWFWRVVTQPYGVRKLVVDRIGGAEFPDRIGLRLLISPSVGPTGTFWFTMQDGKLVAVDR
jgi:hypothetical protein